MSLGQGGHGEKWDEDQEYVLYGYGCYSYNVPNRCDLVLDGFLFIHKGYFLKTKREKAEETLKEWETRFFKYVSFENGCHCFKTVENLEMDKFAYFLLLELEKEVLEGHGFPNQVHIYQ